MNSDAGGKSALGEGLGLLPEGDVTTLSDYFDTDGSRQSLAYSGDQVRALLAAERERCAKKCLRPAGWLNDQQQILADEIRAAILSGA